MTVLQAMLLAVLQGASELFPVSSLGHAVILPALLGWHIDQSGPVFLPFLVMLHVGTAVALMAYFWRDWLALALGALGLADGPARISDSRRVLLLIVIATIPAAIMGGVLEHLLRRLFGSPILVGLVLAANGVLLLACDRLAVRRAQRTLSQLGPVDAAVIGCWQCLALIPGLSRSGATIVAGLRRGVDHAGAAHFSFLIATPIILGATVLEVPKLLRADLPPGTWAMSIEAAVVSGVVAWLSTAFLLRWFRARDRQHDRSALAPFAYYCIAAGLGSAAILALR